MIRLAIRSDPLQRAMRDGAPDRAAGLAMVLCEGNDAGPWLCALRELAERLPGRRVTAGSRADRA